MQHRAPIRSWSCCTPKGIGNGVSHPKPNGLDLFSQPFALWCDLIQIKAQTEHEKMPSEELSFGTAYVAGGIDSTTSPPLLPLSSRTLLVGAFLLLYSSNFSLCVIAFLIAHYG